MQHGRNCTFNDAVKTMNDILTIAHEMGKDLSKVGAMDETTMSKLDALCLPQEPPLQPDDIQRIQTANDDTP